MRLRPARPTRTDTRCPDTTRFRHRLSTQEIDLKAWDRANAQMVDPFIETGSDLLSMLTKDSVIAARARAEARAAETAIGRSHRQLKRSEEHTSELQPLMRISYAVCCLNTIIYLHNTSNINTS